MTNIKQFIRPRLAALQRLQSQQMEQEWFRSSTKCLTSTMTLKIATRTYLYGTLLGNVALQDKLNTMPRYSIYFWLSTAIFGAIVVVATMAKSDRQEGRLNKADLPPERKTKYEWIYSAMKDPISFLDHVYEYTIFHLTLHDVSILELYLLYEWYHTF